MKKSFRHLFVIFLIVISGCSQDIIEKQPYGVQTTENFYKNANQLSQGLTDGYNQIQDWLFEFTYTVAFGDIPTDDAEKGGGSDSDGPYYQDLAYFRAVPTNTACSQLWNGCFAGINRCNIVINKAAQPDVTGDPKVIKRIVNEARFLRGLFYYHLVTAFGGVPIFDHVPIPAEVKAKRNTVAEVYDFIEKDFIAATELPKKSEYPVSEMGRATRGAAFGMLAKTYMFERKYSDAENALKEVVNSSEYSLDPDYGHIWTKSGENGSESVFEVQHKSTKSGWADTEGSVINIWCTDRNDGGWGFDNPTQDLVNEFEPGDPRIIYSIIWNGDAFGKDAPLSVRDYATGYYNRKIFVDHTERDWYNGTDQPYNIRYLRYADLLLLYSEALNENGKTAEALIYLNKVRERARNTNPKDPRRSVQVYPNTFTGQLLPDVTTSDKNVLRVKIWHERRVELAMEYQRRIDLIRQQRYGDVMTAYSIKWTSQKGKEFVKGKSELVPIPQSEIDLSNGSLVQNPGY